MLVTVEQKQRMVKNLDLSFELLDTVMDLRIAYLKKMHPDKTEDQLIQKIHWDIIAYKEKQWNSAKI
jgi:hypothetical protein